MNQQNSTQKPPYLQNRKWKIRRASLEKTELRTLRRDIGCPDTGLPKDEDLYQSIKQHMSKFTTSNNTPGLELKNWTKKNRLGLTEMAVSFLHVKGNGAHFWPDGPEPHVRNLKYSRDATSIERLLVQLYWRINNPEEVPLQRAGTSRGPSPCPSNDSCTSSIDSRRGDHADDPIDVESHTFHGDVPATPDITQENRDNNALLLPIPEPRHRTFEPPEGHPTNGYEIQNTSNTSGGRGRSLLRAPEAPMVDMGHGHTSVKPRASCRARKQISRPDYMAWPDVLGIDEDSSHSTGGSGNLHSVNSSSSTQNISLDRPPTPPPGQREGTSFTVGRLDGAFNDGGVNDRDVHMEDTMPSDNLKSENAAQPPNISADAIAQPRMPSPELNTTPAPSQLLQQEVRSNHNDGLIPTIESYQSDTRDGSRIVPETPPQETIEQDEMLESNNGVTERIQRLPRLNGNLTAISDETWTFPVGDFSRTSLQKIKAKSHIHDATPMLSFTLEVRGKRKHNWTVISNDDNAFKKMRSVYRDSLEEARRKFPTTRNDEELGFDIFLTPNWEQANEV